MRVLLDGKEYAHVVSTDDLGNGLSVIRFYAMDEKSAPEPERDGLTLYARVGVLRIIETTKTDTKSALRGKSARHIIADDPFKGED